MIKYLGSKRLLAPLIVQVARRLKPQGTVVDLFSGTSRVGHALKRAGYRVLSNDHNAYAYVLATCYVQADREDHEREAIRLIQELNRLPGKAGWFTETYCVRSRFFHPKNGARIDAIRERIERLSLHPELKAIVLVSLMEAADRVDSTTGVQMAYLKKWAPRAYNDLEMRLPDILPRASSGKGVAHQMDALEAASILEGDICYVDPPYNQHKYIGNYHIWETLVLWDKPEVYGVACKRIDCRSRKSPFNSKKRAEHALRQVIARAKCEHLIVSFNNEGFIGRDVMESILAERGHVLVIENDFKRYVGAQIGIYNPSGKKVGKVSHLRNKEYLYVVSDDPAAIARVRDLISSGTTASGQGTLPLSLEPSSQPDRPTDVLDERSALREKVHRLLAHRGCITMADAREELGSNVPPSAIRTVLRAMIEEGKVRKLGQRRATKYVWVDGEAIESEDDTAERQPSSVCNQQELLF